VNRLRGGVPWVVVAAGCAAVVGLAGWPRPTLGVLCIVIGATALLAGIRQLLAEHRDGHTPAAVQTGTAAPGERCCVCGGPETPYENYRGLLFCWPCADCPCGQIPCVRTGINDPAVSATAATDPDASGRDPETARTIPDATGQQPADQRGDHPDDLRNRLRDAVAEAIMCGDGDCLTNHHLPKIAQLLGGVDLLEEATPAPVMATPPLTGRMIPAESPSCGTNLPSMDGIPCGEPAAWHIAWRRGADEDETFPAGLACDTHMQQIARSHAWYDRHHAGPDCTSADAEWWTTGCIPTGTQEPS
jgi:hypothetical protein